MEDKMHSCVPGETSLDQTVLRRSLPAHTLTALSIEGPGKAKHQSNYLTKGKNCECSDQILVAPAQASLNMDSKTN